MLTIWKNNFCFITVSKGSNISALLQSHDHVVRSKQVDHLYINQGLWRLSSLHIKVSSCFDQSTGLWLWVETKNWAKYWASTILAISGRMHFVRSRDVDIKFLSPGLHSHFCCNREIFLTNAFEIEIKCRQSQLLLPLIVAFVTNRKCDFRTPCVTLSSQSNLIPRVRDLCSQQEEPAKRGLNLTDFRVFQSTLSEIAWALNASFCNRYCVGYILAEVSIEEHII